MHFPVKLEINIIKLQCRLIDQRLAEVIFVLMCSKYFFFKNQ